MDANLDIGASIFYGSSLGDRLVITNKVTKLTTQLFYLSGLTKVDIPSSVVLIGNEAFSNNNISQGAATIDNSSANVTIGSNVFVNNGAGKNTTITPVFLQ